MKAYKTISKTRLWVALSYRQNFDAKSINEAQYITPIVGLQHKKFMFSYTYTNQISDIVFTNTGFHQISVGVNLFTRRIRAAAAPMMDDFYIGY